MTRIRKRLPSWFEEGCPRLCEGGVVHSQLTVVFIKLQDGKERATRPPKRRPPLLRQEGSYSISDLGFGNSDFVIAKILHRPQNRTPRPPKASGTPPS